MTISWFHSSGKDTNDGSTIATVDGPRYTIQEVVKVLYPARTADVGVAVGDRVRRSSLTAAGTGGDRSRFSQLLLEHGEKHLQDWAVVAYSSPSTQDLSRAIRQQTSNLSSAGNNATSSSLTNNDNSPNGGRRSNLGSVSETQWAQSPSKTNSHNKRSRHNHGSSASGSSVVPLSYKKQQQLLLKQYDKERYPSTQMTKIEGRLHLCSRSLVFEPTDHSRGIVRCPFAKMDHAPQEYPYQEPQYEAMCIAFTSHKHFVMKEHNVIGPFTSVSLPVQFRFTFLHSSPKPFVDLCQQLFSLLASNNHHGNNTKTKMSTTPSSLYATPELDHLLQPMLERPFDLTQLVDVRERPLTPTSLQACLLTPLQRLHGCVVVTTERLYFQPASGVLTPSDTKATHWVLRQVVATACRYSGLRDCALELYFQNATSSVLLAFERRRDREQVLRCLPRNTSQVTEREFVVQAVQAWQQGQLDNYEYLLALNAAAGRSFQDLSRYPVFPWVLSQYESTTSAKKNATTLDLNDPKNYRDLSKPVGALNAERLQYFKTRLEGMQDMDENFLYGTHYSTPGYVLYYLVRSMPEQMLCLQNGKFDAPDRMFHSMSHCFNCVLTNNADVKELIPEFFNYKDYDFLINARGLQLGATQTGERVDDVVLPSWAKSPRDFLKKNRKALESDICTEMLPQWIDLIFGCKSRGEAAKDADNLFHSCCYLGANDLAAMKTQQERFQAELQATEFGLVPDLLFAEPHPRKGETPTLSVKDEGGAVDYYETLVAPEFGAARSLASSSRDYDGGGKEAWELLDPPSINSSHGDQASNQLYPQPTSSSGQESHATAEGTSASPSRGGTGPVLSVNLNAGPAAEVEILMGGVGSDSRYRMLPLSGSGDVDGGKSSGRGAFSSLGPSDPAPEIKNASSYDSNSSLSSHRRHPANSMATPSAEWDMKIIERRDIHGDAVSGCVLVLDGEGGRQPILATTSLDGGLMVHSVSLATPNIDDQQRKGFTGTLSRFSYITMSRGQITPASEQTKLQEYRSHAARDPLACLVLASDGANGQVAFAGGHDDVVLAYGINSACAVASVYSHRDAVTGLDLIPRSVPVPDSALWLERSTHIMVSGSWDATVKVWSVSVAKGETVAVNREPLAELFDADSSIVCVSAISVQHQLPNGGIVIGAGCADGSFCVWNLHNDGVTTVIHNEPARRGSGPCSVLKWSTEAGRTHLFTGFSTGKVASFTLEGGMLRKQSALSFGVAVNCLAYSEGILLVGCADGGLRLIPVREGTNFDAKPSLWSSVNNKNSPGISSLSITYTDAKDGGAKCICCTGGEDGSVALFELKRVMSSSYGTR